MTDPALPTDLAAIHAQIEALTRAHAQAIATANLMLERYLAAQAANSELLRWLGEVFGKKRLTWWHAELDRRGLAIMIAPVGGAATTTAQYARDPDGIAYTVRITEEPPNDPDAPPEPGRHPAADDPAARGGRAGPEAQEERPAPGL